MVGYKRFLLLFCAASIVVLSGLIGNVAIAVTPDGDTPANEGICDGLQGGTSGLYGLCVAYCEAQDLDNIDKQPPSSKILANYRKKMQVGDQDMPCIQAPCPCFSNDELTAMTGDGIASCNRLITNKLGIADDGILNFADVDKSASRERCRYVDVGGSTIIVRNQRLVDDVNSTAAEKAQTCYNLVDTACSTTGQ